MLRQRKSVQMKVKILLMAVLSCLLLFDASAQKNNRKIKITGRVTDINNSPVMGALMMIDGETTSKNTNSKGIYKIKVKPSVSKLGVFTTITGIREEPIDGRTVIDFRLDKIILPRPGTIGASQEVVNDGYGYTKKDDLTKPVTQADVSDNKYASFASIYDVLNTVPGVSVSGNNVTVRGVMTTGNSSPLFVVNGVVVSSITSINPSSVKSIEVLKGPAASVYGLEGANGVILIRTKTGK